MGKTRQGPVTLDAIRAALWAAGQKFIAAINQKHPGETQYCFLFEISCEGFSAHGAVATEEALDRFAQQQLAKGYRTKAGNPLDVIKSCFRWGSPEDAWYQQPDSEFDAVNGLLGRAEKENLFEMYDGTLNRVCLEALTEMDRAGSFGKGERREQVVLGLCYIGGDNSDEEFLGWAKQVNSPSVFERLRREVKQSRSDSRRMVSPNK